MTTKQVRAKKGGQVGLNGEWYFGGQFLAQSAFTIKGELRDVNQKKASKTRKEQIAPYKWELPPTDTSRSIFTIISVTAMFENNNLVRRYILNLATNSIDDDNAKTLGWNINELITKWNNGERWIEPIAE